MQELKKMVATMAAAEAAPEKTIEQRVRERVAAIESGQAQGRHNELKRLRGWLGQGPRKEPSVGFKAGDEICPGIVADKVKRDGHIKARRTEPPFDDVRPVGEAWTISGALYVVAWAKPGRFGLAPSHFAPPPQELAYSQKTSAHGPAANEVARVSLKKRWAAERARRNEGART